MECELPLIPPKCVIDFMRHHPGVQKALVTQQCSLCGNHSHDQWALCGASSDDDPNAPVDTPYAHVVCIAPTPSGICGYISPLLEVPAR